MDEFAISRLYRDQKILEIGEGTNEVQRMVIAKHLGLPAARSVGASPLRLSGSGATRITKKAALSRLFRDPLGWHTSLSLLGSIVSGGREKRNGPFGPSSAPVPAPDIPGHYLKDSGNGC